jgi:hypothetical protein
MSEKINHEELANLIESNLEEYDGDFEESMDGLKVGPIQFSCSGIAYELAEAYLELYKEYKILKTKE